MPVKWLDVFRQRYRLIDTKRSLELLGAPSLDEFRVHYEHQVRDTIARREMARQPHWTGSIAVGAKDFVDRVAEAPAFRRELTVEEVSGGAWVLREDARSLWLGPGLRAKKEA